MSTSPKKPGYVQFGKDLDPAAIEQMENAMSLPVSVKGALMPDAHKGYGLPIGGVLAADNAVIPYAVGVDIACRVKLSVLPVPFDAYDGLRGELKKALDTRTRFGYGQDFKRPKDHSVMDRDWGFCPTVKGLKDKARRQLGTSGAGNHFAEFGKLHLDSPSLGLEEGDYIALLTHSGSRGAGAAIAKHYSGLAQKLCPKLSGQLKHLAWLAMDKEEGLEYFRAMTLMGHYSSANHEVIHREIFKALNLSPAATVENHHNFAFREKIGLREFIVHRKGAVPAAKGTLGIIPGSMADPAFIVIGKGNDDAINSAAHGAGRRMSRTAAFKRFTQKNLKEILTKKRVTLISAGLDEIPMAYKNINQVMSQQKGLVETLAVFEPRLVKMAPSKPRRKRPKRFR
ncbi:MAG: RtcB family protein [Desulfobacterales bacterium]|nr:RtcB family protein [Desulfobacterales bacterium]